MIYSLAEEFCSQMCHKAIYFKTCCEILAVLYSVLHVYCKLGCLNMLFCWFIHSWKMMYFAGGVDGTQFVYMGGS